MRIRVRVRVRIRVRVRVRVRRYFEAFPSTVTQAEIVWECGSGLCDPV